jgi:hypothetical protein
VKSFSLDEIELRLRPQEHEDGHANDSVLLNKRVVYLAAMAVPLTTTAPKD